MLEELGNALSAPRRWLWGMLPGLHDPDSGEAYTGHQVAQHLGMDADSPWTTALGVGLEAAGDPLNLAIPLAGRAVGAAGKALAGGAEGMMPLRRAFTVAKDAAPVGESAAGRAVMTARPIGPAPLADVADALGDFSKHLGEGSNVTASYYPGGKVAVVPQGASAATRRHETVHGMIDALRTGGDAPAPLLMRGTAALQRSPSPFVRGLGEVADEFTAHALAPHDALQGLGSGLKFLLSGSPDYARQIGHVSPLVGALYGNLPYLAAGTAAGGAFLPAYRHFGGQP
jgi:hypothetical protein